MAGDGPALEPQSESVVRALALDAPRRPREGAFAPPRRGISPCSERGFHESLEWTAMAVKLKIELRSQWTSSPPSDAGSSMKRLFALIQSRGLAWNHSEPIEAQPEWTAHAALMDRLTNEGFIVVGGPLEGSSDVLLILRASDEREIEQRLATDVWRQNGLLVAKGCWPWWIRLGSLDFADRADRG